MNKKYLIFLFLVIFCLGLILSHFYSATEINAQVDDPLGYYGSPESYGGESAEGENWVTRSIQNSVFWVLINIGKGLLTITQDLLDWVMSEGFISVKFTDNDIVNAGLEVTKNLGNIIIILASVIIALATILRVKEYQAQKTIPILIFVALLINFAPMLCGVIIDASNITMNYFRDMGGLAPSMGKYIKEGLDHLTGTTLSGQERFGQGIALVVFSFFTSIIYLLYAILFAFRYIALWILIIFSPLAFACYILKFTRKFFTQWWNQFLQWSIIGIPAMFILFLTNEMLKVIDRDELVIAASAGSTGGDIIFKYLLPVVFLIGGFFMTLQTGAAGANIVTGFFDKQVKAGSQKAGVFAQKAAGTAAVTAGAAAVGAARGAKEGKGILGKIKGVGKGIFTREGQESGRETVGKAFERMHVVRPGSYEEGKRKRLKLAEEEKRMKDLSPKELLRIAEMRTITQADEASKATAVKLLGDSGDFAFKGTPKEVKKKEQKAINLANRIGVNLSGLSKSRPELTPEINNEKFQEQLQTEIENFQKKNKGATITPTTIGEKEKIVRRNMIREQVEKIKTKTFREKITPESLKHIDVFLALSPQKIKDIGERGSQKQRITIKEHLAKGSQTRKELIEIRKEALKNKDKEEVQRIDEIVSAIKGNPNY